jgi:Cdc6-like AAA superfamily ATPase
MLFSREKEPTLSQIENAFQPAREIEAPERFAGRKSSVERAYLALLAEGAHIALVGNRGIGKSSLARQLIRIAQGDDELLHKLDIPTDRRRDFLTIYLACGGNVRSYDELLARLLASRDCLYDWVQYMPAVRKEVEALKPKIGVGVAELSGVKESEEAHEREFTSHDIETVFTNAVSAIARSGIAKDGILIVVDEFDQIGDPTGFASFLKSLSTNVPAAKFVIVGVAQDIRELIREHESTDRLFAGGIVKLDPMTDSELAEIIRIAETSINNAIEFDAEAVREVIALARGHPYMVHLVGKYALRSAHRERLETIGPDSIANTLRDIAESGADQVLEGRYKQAILASSQREIVLKAMAESQKGDDREIFTGDAYKIALQRGVDNASQYVGQLVTDDYGAELEKVRERYYRFHDSLFAAYVLARPSLFEGVTTED